MDGDDLEVIFLLLFYPSYYVETTKSRETTDDNRRCELWIHKE